MTRRREEKPTRSAGWARCNGLATRLLFAMFAISVSSYAFAQETDAPAEAQRSTESSAAAETPVPAETPAPADAAPATPAAKPEPVTPPELDPYRVRVSLVFNSDPQWTATFRGDVRTELRSLAARTVGQMWTLDIADNEWIGSRNIAGIERATAEEVLQHDGKENLDKVFLVAVESVGPQTRIGVREWDEASRELGPVATAGTWERRDIADRVFALIQRLFHPVLAVDRARDYAVTLRLRAGAFPAVDPQAEQVRPGDFLAPMLRLHDRDQKLAKVAYVPHAFLLVESVERHRVTTKVIARIPNPFAGRTRRVERMAIRLRPEFESTRLKIEVKTKTSTRPLVGHRVEIVKKTLPLDKPDGEPLQLICDRDGECISGPGPAGAGSARDGNLHGGRRLDASHGRKRTRHVEKPARRFGRAPTVACAARPETGRRKKMG
jgi:hypothetical protein